MQSIESLEHGNYYHIYNRAINNEDLFRSDDNYLHFLHLYKKYIENIADTYAWCLLKNHFHVLVRIKEKEEVEFVPIKRQSPTTPPSGCKTTDGVSNKQYNPSHQFSHLFNAYAQAINKLYNRNGGLFERPFKRKLITSDSYFKDLVTYIHNNPVHHGFCDRTLDYPWTSYQSILSDKESKLKRKELIGWFDSKENFMSYHEQKQDYINIEKYALE